MPVNIVDLKRDTREGVGRVSEAEYDDDRLDAAVKRAVLELSRYTPKLAKAKLNTVQGQDIYNVTDLLNPNDTAFTDEVLVVMSDSWSNFSNSRFAPNNNFISSLGNVTHPLLGPGGDSEPFVSVGSFATDLFLHRVEDELIQRDTINSIEFRNDQFIITPTPDSAIVVHFLLGIAHLTEQVPTRFYEILLTKSKEIAAEDLIALRRGKFAAVRVGASSVPIDVSELNRLRLEWQEEFKSKAQSIPPLVMP